MASLFVCVIPGAHAQTPTPRPAAAQPQPPPPKFDLNEIQVTGSTVLDEREIDAAVYPFLGPGRTRDDVEQARAALEDVLKRKGYLTVAAFVPPQDARDGVVTIQIIEQRVGRVRVNGARYVAPSEIRRSIPSLAEGKVPNLNDVQADIVKLNNLPDRVVTPSALQAGREPNTVDVDLKVEDTLPVHGTLEINNRQGLDTQPLRLAGNLQYTNLWQRGDTASVGFQLAPQNPSDATVVTASYLFNIPDSRAQLLTSFVHSDSNVTTLGSTGVVGKGDIVQERLILPLGSTADFTHSLSAGIDYKNLTQQTSVAGEFTNVPTEYYPFSVNYAASWSGERSSTDAQATLTWAFAGLGSDTNKFDFNRFNASPGFFAIKGDVSRTQDLPFGLQAYARAQVQASPDALVSSEQFNAGGADTVRGYFESEALGDTGGAGQLELRSPELADKIGLQRFRSQINSLRVHAFLDGAAVRINDPLPEQTRSSVLASVGVGARFRLFDHLSGEVQDAIPLRRGPRTGAGTNRVLFRLYGDF